MTLLLFIASSLFVWRLSKMITEEEGPFMIFTKIRASLPYDGKRGWTGRGFTCLWCVSLWIGLCTGLALTTPVFVGPVYGLACSSIAIVFDSVLEYILGKSRKL